ncbi:MAG TPA: ankyrin repeat domain-containing protein [Roseiflexaceae bacterium]|nr:ankyrin repeat domain-containing protein [Roseiflexaceae bacterium]
MNDQLHTAAERGDTTAVLNLLAAGAHVDAQDERGRTAVLAATHGHHADTVRALIEAGADINLRDNRNDNVLLYSGAEGLLDIVRLAVAAGADTRLTNRYGGIAIIPAAERGHVEVVRELLTTSDIDVNHVNKLGWTALLEAIVLSNGGPRHQQIVELLIAHGADVNLPDNEGVTPLQHARQRGFAEIERMLAEAGAR